MRVTARHAGHVAVDGNFRQEENSSDTGYLAERRQAQQEPLGATLEERLAAAPDKRLSQPTARPRKKRADGRPSGAKRAALQVGRDISKVKELMLLGHRRSEVLAEFPKLSSRTVDRYIAHVNEEYKRDAELAKPFEVETSIARISELSRKAQKAEAWSAVRGFESMLLDIRGVRAPERHDVRAVVAALPQAPAIVEVDPGELLRAEGVSDEDLEAVLRVAGGLVQKRLGSGG